MSGEGRFFEDFEVGDIYEHRLGRTITDTDNMWFTLLTLNTNPLHFDHNYAAAGEFGQPLVNSAFTVALVAGQSVEDVSENAVANLGWENIELLKPVLVGDTLYARSEVLAVRPSKSRPYAGVVTVRTEGFNQKGVIVIAFKRTIMIYKRGHSPRSTRPTVVPSGKQAAK